jgi:hypothetical protein
MIKTAGCTEDCLCFDALNYAESVIWVNDLVTNLECHTSPKAQVTGKEFAEMSSPSSIPEDKVTGNENCKKTGAFRAFLPFDRSQTRDHRSTDRSGERC